ncbi:MAG: CotS family spore coat protein [Lachnospiraceae bacterium]|nr:CotS family spore coat protein [Lachnospiraceae bacterium]
MNDRALGVLEKYDIEVLRSWKGRSAILCETKTGVKILKEYKGGQERLLTQKVLLEKIKEKGFCNVESIIPTKEGELLVKDDDMNSYYLKEYFPGKECNIKETWDMGMVSGQMALLHKAMELPELITEKNLLPYSLPKEFEKHNRELRKVKKYLKTKRQKNDFEYFLYKNYDFFLKQAEKVLEEVNCFPQVFAEEKLLTGGCLCHGDFQHHNALVYDERVYIINFEKYVVDHPMRDFSLFFRKVMEKNNWKEEIGQLMLQSYQRQKPLSEEDRIQLYCRLSYPEKFRKIVNFYYGSSKVWIPDKNMEKLDKILKQEEEKTNFLKRNFKDEVLHKC